MNSNKLINGSIKRTVHSERIGLLIALVFMILVFSWLTGNNFFTVNNIRNILIASSIVGLVTIGEGYLLISGQVDLSPGSVAAFSSVLVAFLLSLDISMWIAIPLVVLCGMIIGIFNAFMVTKLKFEPFIATLASMFIFRGLAYIICDGKSIFVTERAFLRLGVGRIAGVPIPVIISILMFILFGIILNRTKFGRSIYMVGGNATAARLAGIRTNLVKGSLFMITSGFAALGGIILAARMSSGQPSASVGLEFDAVTACVLGGMAMAGGIGTLSGALIGLLIMQGFNNGLMMLNVQSFWQTVARGALLITALTFDYIRNRQREAKLKNL